MYDDINVDWRSYAEHDDNKICGFFGDYLFLTNTYPCEVYYDGIKYLSVENAYHAAKLVPESREYFTTCSGYESCKHIKIDKSLKFKYSEVIWNSRRVGIMKELLLQKFKNPKLRELLIRTENRYLEETNHWQDTFYGVDYQLGGENNLGKILMEVRSKLNVHQLLSENQVEVFKIKDILITLDSKLKKIDEINAYLEYRQLGVNKNINDKLTQTDMKLDYLTNTLPEIYRKIIDGKLTLEEIRDLKIESLLRNDSSLY